MRRRIAWSEGGEPGTWWQPKGAKKPFVACPHCGGTLLGDDAPHTIEDNGNVNASLVCRHPGCTFHEFVTLWGWKCECHVQPPYGFVISADCPYHD